MCEFCMLFNFSSVSARVQDGDAFLMKAPTDIPFLPKQQFNFCPVCGSPRTEQSQITSESFGRNLRKIRKMRGISQTALGNAIGVQKSCVSKYEKGRVSPSMQQIIRISKVLGISPKELL